MLGVSETKKANKKPVSDRLFYCYIELK